MELETQQMYHNSGSSTYDEKKRQRAAALSGQSTKATSHKTAKAGGHKGRAAVSGKLRLPKEASTTTKSKGASR